MAIHQAIWLHIGDCRERAVHEVGEEIGDVSHVIGDDGRVVRFALRRVCRYCNSQYAIGLVDAIGIEGPCCNISREYRGHVSMSPVRRLHRGRNR